MTTVDIVILVIVALSSIFGMFRGLIKEALSLLTWIAAIFISGIFGVVVGDLFSGLTDSETIQNVSGFAVLFIVCIFVGTLISNLVSRLFAAIGLAGADKVLGTLFGLLRGTVIILVILALTVPFEFTAPWYEGSIIIPYAIQIIEYLQQILV